VTSVSLVTGSSAIGQPLTVTNIDERYCQKVVQAFNTWAFKRQQPCRPELLARCVADAIHKNEPIDFVLYWGKGPRAAIASPELQCLDYLGALGARVRATYAPGIAIHLVLTDSHARLNGHSDDSIAAYYLEVEREAVRRGFACHRLAALSAATEVGPIGPDEVASPETLSTLEESAMKWYRGEGTARDGAAKYYRMNMIEKRVIAKVFPNAVFVTFNGSEQRELFPETLPIFYMYSTKRGTAVKPWFQAANDQPTTLAAAAS
jgi:hypothetical protein